MQIQQRLKTHSTPVDFSEELADCIAACLKCRQCCSSVCADACHRCATARDELLSRPED
ncbi:hypothetical protein [Salinisphaera sp. LB1]|uniref:hypothetical protein n=1 Tax=Salinisphaera sp. LB1 TaxID=2183911 RepID=UPI000D7DEB40|nr:hypothetical protein [Salinisphaera sp. LB1]AWN15530.1 hypothetical protein SALB1_1327 [Salinisphaera sp. LB1]